MNKLFWVPLMLAFVVGTTATAWAAPDIGPLPTIKYDKKKAALGRIKWADLMNMSNCQTWKRCFQTGPPGDNCIYMWSRYSFWLLLPFGHLAGHFILPRCFLRPHAWCCCWILPPLVSITGKPVSCLMAMSWMDSGGAPAGDRILFFAYPQAERANKSAIETTKPGEWLSNFPIQSVIHNKNRLTLIRGFSSQFTYAPSMGSIQIVKISLYFIYSAGLQREGCF